MTITPSATPEQIRAAADAVAARGASAPRAGRDPINQPMVNNWLEAMGDENPIYVDDAAARAAGHPSVVAPPAMAQVWTMRGLHGVRTDDDPLGLATELFDDAGYTSVVATNCDTVYHRYTRPGEEVTISSELVDVVGPKQTALGEGWFFTTRNTWRVGDEIVAEMDFRILKFRPTEVGRVNDRSEAEGVHRDNRQVGRVNDRSEAEGVHRDPAPAPVSYEGLDPANLIRPTASRDTAFFWDGVAAHELRIQQLPDGSLRHPPIPATWTERGDDGEYPGTDYTVAKGTGTVYSFVVHHAPKVPGRELPFVVALVELDEGVRMLGQLRGVDPDQVRIGMPVEVEFLDFAEDPDGVKGGPWTLYAWRATEEVAK